MGGSPPHIPDWRRLLRFVSCALPSVENLSANVQAYPLPQFTSKDVQYRTCSMILAECRRQTYVSQGAVSGVGTRGKNASLDGLPSELR